MSAALKTLKADCTLFPGIPERVRVLSSHYLCFHLCFRYMMKSHLHVLSVVKLHGKPFVSDCTCHTLSNNVAIEGLLTNLHIQGGPKRV